MHDALAPDGRGLSYVLVGDEWSGHIAVAVNKILRKPCHRLAFCPVSFRQGHRPAAHFVCRQCPGLFPR